MEDKNNFISKLNFENKEDYYEYIKMGIDKGFIKLENLSLDEFWNYLKIVKTER